jgi:hypothetical protein
MKKITILFFCIAVLLCSLCFAEKNEKWIVLTTIQYPTEALKKLAIQPGWRIVVVADKKTPSDWLLANCDFLSVERQQELGYEILQYLPWNHYCRKNIGYLYAIENGAKRIYETDDDNLLLSEIAWPKTKGLREVDSEHGVVNVYAYFGQPTLWPRGFPLEKIAISSQFNEQKALTAPLIGVVQGLVDKDPDVDAIYRLTQEREVYCLCA